MAAASLWAPFLEAGLGEVTRSGRTPPWFLPSDFLFCGDTAALAWAGEKKKPPESPPRTWRTPLHVSLPGARAAGPSAVPRGVGSMRHFLDKAQMWPPVRHQASSANSLPFSQPLNTCPRARKRGRRTGSSLLQGGLGQKEAVRWQRCWGTWADGRGTTERGQVLRKLMRAACSPKLVPGAGPGLPAPSETAGTAGSTRPTFLIAVQSSRMSISCSMYTM